MTLDQEKVKEHAKRCEEKREQMRQVGAEGPWMIEDDRVEFKHAGLDCLLVRNCEMLNWCGYVGVPYGHPLYGMGYDETYKVTDLDAHGGLTYSDACHSTICHKQEQGKPHMPNWWFGFDCAHAWDVMPVKHLYAKTIPNWPTFPGVDRDESYKDQKWVIAQTKILAEQLAKEASFKATLKRAVKKVKPYLHFKINWR